MEYQGKFFKWMRKGLRLLGCMTYKTPPREEFTEPAVYICRHGNMRGPVLSMVNIPMPIHPWAFYVFCDKDTCYKHYCDYTFSVRFGWKKWQAQAISRLIAGGVAKLVNSAGGIPVYRNSAKVMSTFRLSLEALGRGESLLIFPEVDYTAEEGEVGKMYEGFLMLEKMYLKETGKHLPFIPMHLSEKKRTMVLGEAICFRDGKPFAQERDEVITRLQKALNALKEEDEQALAKGGTTC